MTTSPNDALSIEANAIELQAKLKESEQRFDKLWRFL